MQISATAARPTAAISAGLSRERRPRPAAAPRTNDVTGERARKKGIDRWPRLAVGGVHVYARRCTRTTREASIDTSRGGGSQALATKSSSRAEEEANESLF